MATHSTVIAWEMPCIEESGRLQSKGFQRVGHDWATKLTKKIKCLYNFSKIKINKNLQKTNLNEFQFHTIWEILSIKLIFGIKVSLNLLI